MCIRDRLAVATQEHFTLDTHVADSIAIGADGSYRDALGSMQKVMMASGDTVLTADEVALIIGAPKNVLLQEVFAAFSEKNSEKGLTALAEAVRAHVDMKLFTRLLLERVRTVPVSYTHLDVYKRQRIVLVKYLNRINNCMI